MKTKTIIYGRDETDTASDLVTNIAEIAFKNLSISGALILMQ